MQAIHDRRCLLRLLDARLIILQTNDSLLRLRATLEQDGGTQILAAVSYSTNSNFISHHHG